jgi:hypothetical protein
VDLHDQRNVLDPPDRRDVADEIETELLIEPTLMAFCEFTRSSV